MRARIVITVIALILYVGLFNVYLYDLTRINIATSKIFYNLITLFGVGFFALDIKAGFVNHIHKQFNLLLILCVLINYVIIICTHAEWITDTDNLFYSFNVSVFAITLTIFICEMKYKTFRD
jgi:hypothetical protein